MYPQEQAQVRQEIDALVALMSAKISAVNAAARVGHYVGPVAISAPKEIRLFIAMCQAQPEACEMDGHLQAARETYDPLTALASRQQSLN